MTSSQKSKVNASGSNSYKLPCDTQSLCPTCLEVIDARLYEQDGKVFMSKTCAMHGPFHELISSDAEFFTKLRRTHFASTRKMENPHCKNISQCPKGCGLCEQHQTTPALINIDLTNRCNLTCPVCFANSNVSGRLCEITLEQLDKMLEAISQIKPNPPVCIQFAGGEPTIHKDFVEAVRRAAAMGFLQVQVASNGLRFARQPELCHAASEAGLNQVYLQFDGITDDVYIKTRGRALMDIKLQAIENIKKANMRVTLVPTIIRGVNDHQVGDIARFAIKNVDVISSISWQPVSITGRIDESKRLEMRYTTADLARDLQQQTEFMDMHRDWYPFSIIEPFVRLTEAITKSPKMHWNCSPHCGCVTYMVVDKQNNSATTLPSFIDIEETVRSFDKLATRIKNHPWTAKLSIIQALRMLKKHFNKGPEGWGFKGFQDFIMSYVDYADQHADKATYMRQIAEERFGTLFMAGMHFQDSYNYELDRSQHCLVVYAAPNGRFYPFCTWNSGPSHRYAVEEQFSMPLQMVNDMPAADSVCSRADAGLIINKGNL